jgi:uncharacterized membrane protein YdjX (TVP38/TMEM64 family)
MSEAPIRIDGKSRRSLAARLALPAAAALVLAALILAGRSLAGVIPDAIDQVRRLGPLAPFGCVALYAVATVGFVPGSLLTLAAGAIFGLGLGTAVVMGGATLGASAAFLVARHLARRLVERKLATWPRFAALDHAISAQGRKVVFLLRLSPIVPFNALNYALGVTRVRFLDYLVASVGMLPASVLYVYYGHVAGDLARLAAGDAAPRGAAHYTVLAAGLLATLLATAVITRTARQALAAASVRRVP